MYIRHVCLWVVLGAVLARHWVAWLRPPGDSPISFIAALGVGVALIVWQASLRNRADSR